MNIRNTSAANQEASGRHEEHDPLNFLTDVGRRQLALVSEGISALCRGSEVMRGIQRDAAHEASAYHADVARKLRDPCQPGDLMAIQSELMRYGIQSAGKYWQQLGAQMMQTQVEMMSSVSQLLEADKAGPVPPPLGSNFFVFDPLAWTGSHGDAESAAMHH